MLNPLSNSVLRKPAYLLFSLSFSSLFLNSCKPDKPSVSQTVQLPTLEEIDSLQKQNTAGEAITNPENIYNEMAQHPVVGFGHLHSRENTYISFRNMIPKLREKGFLMLAIEMPSSLQPIIDSIMDENTPKGETNRLLSLLNDDFKKGDGNKEYNTDQKVLHPLFELVLDWLGSGGMIVAIDVPYIYESSLKKNIYNTDMMFKTVKENSASLYDKIKDININNLDEDKDINLIAEIRSAYMSALLNHYQLQGSKTVAFLGTDHIINGCKIEGTVSISIKILMKDYYNTDVLNFYPYFTNQNNIFYKGNILLAKYAYGVK